MMGTSLKFSFVFPYKVSSIVPETARSPFLPVQAQPRFAYYKGTPAETECYNGSKQEFGKRMVQ
jgi:hypothetical protein